MLESKSLSDTMMTCFQTDPFCTKVVDIWSKLLFSDKNCIHIEHACSIFMMTSSNGNIFRVTGHLCGEFTVPGEFCTQRPVTRSFDVYFDLRPNKRLSKQWWGWWFDTQSCPLWRHCNGSLIYLDLTVLAIAFPVIWLALRRSYWCNLR